MKKERHKERKIETGRKGTNAERKIQRKRWWGKRKEIEGERGTVEENINGGREEKIKEKEID